MEEIKKLANDINDTIEAKGKETVSKIEAVEKAFEAKLEAKGVEVDSLKAEIKVISDRADELDLKLQKEKESKKVERKSLGERLAESVAELGGGDFEKGADEAYKMLKTPTGSLSLNLKAVADMTTSGSLTGDPVISYNSRQSLVPNQKLNFRDLVSSVNSPTGVFATFEETGSEGSISAQTEGSAKSQIDYDFTERKLTNAYIAGFARFSKQLMKNLPFLEQTLVKQLMRDFYKAENASFFSTVSGAATGTATYTATNHIEIILELIANQGAANFNPSFGLVSYQEMARLQIATFGKGYYSGAGTVQLTPSGINLNGMSIMPASWVTDDKILIIDSDYLERVEVEGLNVTFSYDDASNFTQNKVTARIECYEGINLMKASSAIYADLTA